MHVMYVVVIRICEVWSSRSVMVTTGFVQWIITMSFAAKYGFLLAEWTAVTDALLYTRSTQMCYSTRRVSMQYSVLLIGVS